MLALGLVFVAMAMVMDSLWALAAGTARERLHRLARGGSRRSAAPAGSCWSGSASGSPSPAASPDQALRAAEEDAAVVAAEAHRVRERDVDLRRARASFGT